VNARQQRSLLLRATSADLTPSELLPGRDAVLTLSVTQGCSLSPGVLIDDHLDFEARQAVDRIAHAAIAEWRSRMDEALTIEGICLSDIWHSELFAEVFLPVARVMAGVRAAVVASGSQQLVCHGLDADLVDALRVELAPITVRATVIGPAPSYPSDEATPRVATHQPMWQRLARWTIDTVGLRSFARGEVLVLPYLSTLSVLERLADEQSPRPVVYSGALPSVPIALRAARRGGWLGLPGYPARRRARKEARHCLAAAAQAQWAEISEPGVARLLHTRALRCLAGRALETTAIVPGLQALFKGGRVRAIVLPFDHEPTPKTIIRVAQAAGVPTLFVQHGYEPYRVFHTGTLTSYAAVWSSADRLAFPEDMHSRVRVVGNPRKQTLTSAVTRRGEGRPVAVVLAEHHARHSSILDRRVTAMHLVAAIEGLRASGPEWQILVRPHPSDDMAEFVRMVAAVGAEGVEVDGHSSATDLLARADLCVGALSTMTLEAALMGTRVVMLNPEGVNWSPPLHRGGPVPTAQDAKGLARLVDEVMSASKPPGAAALLEGLGVGPEDPAGHVLNWLREIIAGHSGEMPGVGATAAADVQRTPARS
jgi:hypothetical protein